MMPEEIMSMDLARMRDCCRVVSPGVEVLLLRGWRIRGAVRSCRVRKGQLNTLWLTSAWACLYSLVSLCDKSSRPGAIDANGTVSGTSMYKSSGFAVISKDSEIFWPYGSESILHILFR